MFAVVSSSWTESLVQFLTVFAILVVVIILAYLSTRIVGKVQSGVYERSNIKVLDTMKIANNRYIQIVKIGDKCIAIAVGKEEVTFLGEVTEDSLKTPEVNVGNKLDFAQVMAKLKKNNQEKK